MDRIQNAIAIATLWHGTQYRKHFIGGSRLPFITHPLEVMKRIWSWGAGTEDMMQAAVCHDLLEDTSVNVFELSDIITPMALSIVKELTFVPKSSTVTKETIDKYKYAFSQEKAEYMSSFDKKSIKAFVIKVADRICNCYDFNITNKSYAVEYYYKAQSLWDIIGSRKGDIDTEFGDVVYGKMLTEYNLLRKTLGA